VIAGVVSFQNTARTAATWRDGLRQRTVDRGALKGLRGLSLADNPRLGAAGLGHLCSALVDDAYILGA